MARPARHNQQSRANRETSRVRNFFVLISFLIMCACIACAPAPDWNVTETPRAARTVVVVVPRDPMVTETPPPTGESEIRLSATFVAPTSNVASATATPFLTAPPAGQPVSIPILMYHHLQVLSARPSQIQRDWTVAPEQFTAQLDYLRTHGFETITFAQLVAFFEQGGPLPLHPVILTFDDGWLDDYTVAFPALRERGMVGTFFVATTYAQAGGKTLIGWSQIAEMDAAGMEFGGHTLNHADLKKVGRAEALRQLETSKLNLEQKLGHPTLAFSYPNGAADAGVMALVKQVGYRAAVGLCCGYKLRADQLLLLPRIRISYDDTLDDFIKKLPTSL